MVSRKYGKDSSFITQEPKLTKEKTEISKCKANHLQMATLITYYEFLFKMLKINGIHSRAKSTIEIRKWLNSSIAG